MLIFAVVFSFVISLIYVKTEIFETIWGVITGKKGKSIKDVQNELAFELYPADVDIGFKGDVFNIVITFTHKTISNYMSLYNIDLVDEERFKEACLDIVETILDLKYSLFDKCKNPEDYNDIHIQFVVPLKYLYDFDLDMEDKCILKEHNLINLNEPSLHDVVFSYIGNSDNEEIIE
jgi:hypothetical protein